MIVAARSRRVAARWTAALGIALAADGCGHLPDLPPPWSAPVGLGCAGTGGGAVAFPSRSPADPGGPGALAWSSCRGVVTAALGLADRAGRPRPVAGPATGLTGLTATGSGRVLAALHMPGGRASVVESRGARPVSLGGPAWPVAMAASWVGDVAVLSVSGRATGRVALRRQRHGVAALGAPITLSAIPAPVTALAVSLDYRGDVLAAWQQQDAVYAREVHAGGSLGPLERVGASLGYPPLQTLISDNGRGMVAWVSQPATGGPTVVYLSVSGPRLSFGEPRVVETFDQPAGRRLPAGSLRLRRLASESVLLAWTGRSDGHYVVRAAPVSLLFGRPETTISRPGTDAVLEDLATGPRSEAIALWDAGPQVVAARGFVAAPGVALFGEPELLGAGTTDGPAAVAVDPATDRAVATWRRQGRIVYAVRAASPHGL